MAVTFSVDGQVICCFLGQTGVNAKAFGSLTEALVFRPQKGRRIDKDRGYEVCVGKTDAEAVQTTSLNG